MRGWFGGQRLFFCGSRWSAASPSRVVGGAESSQGGCPTAPKSEEGGHKETSWGAGRHGRGHICWLPEGARCHSGRRGASCGMPVAQGRNATDRARQAPSPRCATLSARCSPEFSRLGEVALAWCPALAHGPYIDGADTTPIASRSWSPCAARWSILQRSTGFHSSQAYPSTCASTTARKPSRGDTLDASL